jgi:hypothetical protein
MIIHSIIVPLSILKSYKMKTIIKKSIYLFLIAFILINCKTQNEKTIIVEPKKNDSSIDLEKELITKTLNKYINGSTGGQPKLLKEAFHPNLNLYYVKNNQISTWSGTAYIEDTKEGQPTGESGKILFIDYTNDAAVAKIEIAHPKSETPYIDYFMLLKTNGKWTIVHKMFTKKISKE